MKQPDPRLHLQISLVKSALRIFGAGALMSGAFLPAGLLFAVAELLGILEELV
jgi:hypothetical protein